ncbi:unnamed protein product [Tilletia controversa]|uniref:Uncharacterized protein n=1 Tax=Tilletia caries TaxID=13290 RepID=A0A177VFW9_9BASI|nr:hypothetical protein CF336_g529 [Tilletia laevis]KAE8263918.1 hypothetical protein A4X03_0g1330 [Tilletia caries]CAD6944651.1 unnamed protein product [Tilletia controversa]KAE8208670.1 hypothetical protein CF335_g243 [Tilletia laevis]CAD6919599.1 unnamed protein product [Tilletia caries]
MQLITALIASLSLSAAAVSAQTVAQLGTGGADAPKFSYGRVSGTYPGVRSTASNGETNPSKPSLGTTVNQQSMARLASVNSIDDWCTFGPPGTDQPIGNIEAEAVAYCTKARNNARVIPDGTLTSVHFVKTPLYVQVSALGDFTKIGVMPNDDGGELDPHGATGLGNPVGGNVTSNVTGTDVFYEEWMNFVSYNQVCIRICTAGGSGVSAAKQCEHELDIMGCAFVMATGQVTDNVFESCDGDAAYPPGLYPDGSGTSTFKQYFVGSYVQDGETISYTNGAIDQATPTAAFSIPVSSNCATASTVANGIASLVTTASSSTTTAAPTTGSSSSGMSSSRNTQSSSSRASSSSSAGQTAGASPSYIREVGSGAWKVGAAMAGAAVLGLAVLA